MLSRRSTALLFVLLWFVAPLLLVLPLSAQEAAGRLVITDSNATSLPELELRAYGVSSDGEPLDLATMPLTVTHDGQPAESLEVIGSHPAGTFTLFVIDLPPGVSGQLSAVQAAIEQFATPEFMQEQVDAVAIYRVGQASAEQLLAPTAFHNEVRNLFQTPLQTQAGATALYDSVVGLLDQIEQLKPRADMFASVVLITDGTDAVSEQFEATDVPARATALGVPIHTIWLDNDDLSEGPQQAGREYLLDVANASGGIAASLDNGEQVVSIWERIGGFRQQTVIHYTVENLAGGTFPVSLSLVEQPEATASTTINVPAGAPLIDIVLPPESRTLSLPSLNNPVRLVFNTEVTWLDGVERPVDRAQLLVNDQFVQDIDPAELAAFEAEIDNLVYGANSVRVIMVDANGGQATSPIMLLNVEEGPRFIPVELRPAGAGLADVFGGFPWLACLLGLLFLVLLLGFIVWWFRIRIPGVAGLRQRIPIGGQKPVEGDGAPVAGPAGMAGGFVDGLPHLEVIQAHTLLPDQLPLDRVEVRLGRSPAEADIVFEHDPTVSRLHASLVRDGDDYRLYDEQSTSGTLVNGLRVPPHGVVLIDGDEIHLGAVHLRFHQR